MPFEIPENIHPNCARLAWIIGTWAGNGHGEYEGMEDFEFGQEVIFQQDGRPFIHYLSRSWIIDADGNHVREAAQETGFIRPQPDGTLEVVMAHNLGFVEIWHGELDPEAPRFEIVTDAVARTSTAKEYTAGKRLYGYVNGDLLYAYDMAAMGKELQPHTHAQLVRQ
ncbi:MAG: FABP family protein [Propionibacteriales bacterium]|nr:FABP family protein [Propionibacteriales bacterium]